MAEITCQQCGGSIEADIRRKYCDGCRRVRNAERQRRRRNQPGVRQAEREQAPKPPERTQTPHEEAIGRLDDLYRQMHEAQDWRGCLAVQKELDALRKDLVGYVTIEWAKEQFDLGADILRAAVLAALEDVAVECDDAEQVHERVGPAVLRAFDAALNGDES